MVLDAAAAEGINIAFHLEPYEGRSATNVHADLHYLAQSYGEHPALLRVPALAYSGQLQPDERTLPVYYVYDSYHLPPSDWQRLLTPSGDLSVRGTPADVFAIGLLLEDRHLTDLAVGGFDGAYTYFGIDGFSFGSSTGNWLSIADRAAELGLTLSLSLSPGYDDSRIRPWNAHNRRDRANGAYYDAMWEAALRVPCEKLDFISITSFNEWGEGTQIESAVPYKLQDVDALAAAGLALNATMRAALGLSDTFLDYSTAYTAASGGGGGPDSYLQRTRHFAERWVEARATAAVGRGSTGGSVATAEDPARLGGAGGAREEL